MSQSWIEKYNQRRNSPESPTDNQEDFDLFYQHSDLDHVRVDTEKAWNNVLARLDKEQPTKSFNWLRTIAASLLILLAAGFAIYQVTNDSNGDTVLITEISSISNKVIELPDGSIVTLAHNSSLKYPSESFIDNRKVYFSGEGFFEVVKNNNPFTVEAQGATIEVLGTAFGLDARNNTRVTVENGHVSLRTEKSSINLHEGESAVANRENGEITSTETDPNELSWKTGKFEFSETELYVALEYLNKYYPVSFSCSKALRNCKVTVSFDQASVTDVTDILATILNAKKATSNKEVRFSGKGCN